MIQKTNILELNNIDIYGKRFNGYSICEYINQHKNLNLNATLLVNHKLGHSNFVQQLFNNAALEKYDWETDAIENNLGTKNQISISENALINHPAYKNANILHFHMYHNMHLPIEFLTRIPKEKKIIIDIHDTFWLTDRNIPMLEVFKASNINRNSLNAQRKRVLESIDAEFIVHSQYIMRLFKQSAATKNLKVRQINFGIDPNVFKPLPNAIDLRKKWRIPEDNIVLFCRAQKEFKGLDYIINALKKLDEKKSITIITVGEKNLLSDLTAKYQILDFGITGSEAEMNELYNICDIFLAPSTEESFGFMAVEAMSCSKPIIVFDGTALPDTVNAPTIGISIPRSSDNLAQAIKHLIKSPKERKRRGEAGRKFVIEKYNETNYYLDNISLYEKLSKIPYRSPSIVSAPTHAQNIQKFEKYLNLENQNPEIFNYNDANIQNALYLYNKKIYNKIKKEDHEFVIYRIIKKTIPAKLKHKLKKLKERLS